LHNDCTHRVGQGADFYAVYHGGHNFKLGLSPYLNNHDNKVPYYYPFRYLPIVAFVQSLLLEIQPKKLYLYWIILLEHMLFFLIFIISKHIHNKHLRLFAAAALIMNTPYFLELYMGQFTFASMSLLTMGILASGGMITYTLSILLKIFPIVTVPALIRHRRFWFHIGIALVSLLLLSIPFFLKRPEDWKFFYNMNTKIIEGMNCGNFSLIYLIHLISGNLKLLFSIPGWQAFMTIIRVLILIGTSAIVLLSKDNRISLTTVSLILAHFLSYAHVWEHHFSAVIIAGILLFTIQHQKKWAIPSIIISLLLISLPTSFVLFDKVEYFKAWDPAILWPNYASYLILLQKIFPLFILYGICIFTLCSAGFYRPVQILKFVKQTFKAKSGVNTYEN
jgi:hypothetical protein